MNSTPTPNAYQAGILVGLNRTAKHIYAGFETTTVPHPTFDDPGGLNTIEVLTERGVGQRNRCLARRAKNRVARASRKANRR